ncbi:NADH:ubiquinone reductase (Na(+)-transporting) subunit F [Rhodobacteraceae bacterium CCMM004]|nr:NADH:ubiquinone reductase (Na(+)-transporting) subunit F [Rhodobacteraceae bacterium CCMM004]
MSAVALATVLLVALILALTLTVMGARRVLIPRRPVTVAIRGGADIPATTGAHLLEVLNGAGVPVPSGCAGAGTCGLCRVQVTEGSPDALPTEAAHLSRAELAQGMHLACQVTLRDDLTVALPDALLSAERFDCRVASVRLVTPLIREIVLQMPQEAPPEIVAGAYVQIAAPPFRLDYAQVTVPDEFAPVWAPLRRLSVTSDETVTRAYSVANRPEDQAAGRIVLNIRLALPPPGMDVPPGVVSSWLFSISEGDTVAVAGPFGEFRAQETGREMVVIGGGVGMAPLRAIVHEQLAKGSGRTISFWYGARSRTELYYADEFDALAAAHPNFRWVPALSDPAPGDAWDGATGFVHRVVWEEYLKAHPAPEDCEYYLCGPPLMIRAVRSMLEDAGVEDETVFSDDFGV